MFRWTASKRTKSIVLFLVSAITWKKNVTRCDILYLSRNDKFNDDIIRLEVNLIYWIISDYNYDLIDNWSVHEINQIQSNITQALLYFERNRLWSLTVTFWIYLFPLAISESNNFSRNFNRKFAYKNEMARDSFVNWKQEFRLRGVSSRGHSFRWNV